MKKVKKDAPRQERRTRALARFSINPQRTDDPSYITRKERERHALRAALGL